MAGINNIALYVRARDMKRKKTTVQLCYIYHGSPFYLSTSVRIDPALWDEEKRSVRMNKKAGSISITNQEIEITNRQLQAVLMRAKGIILDASREGIDVTPNYLKGQLAPRKEVKPVQEDVLEIWQMFIDYQRESFEVQPATLKAYSNAKTHFTNYCKAKKLKPSFDLTTPVRVKDFITYLKGLKLTNTTCDNVVKNLKRFCSWAYEHGYLMSDSFRSIKRPGSDETDFVYFSEKELEQFASASLPPHLERVRDLFVIQATTGLRYSDVANLKPVNRDGSFLTVKTVKTVDTLKIPLLPAALAIYQKYEGGILPKAPQNQPYNRSLKEVAQLAGFTQMVPITVIKQGKRIDMELPKYQKISSHTARRSFIINSLQRRVRPEVLMKFTGHKDIKTLMRYVRITPEIAMTEFLRAYEVDTSALVK